MKQLVLFAALLAAFTSARAYAFDLDEMPPREQIEQSCDTAVMNKLDADKVIAYTFGEPTYTKVTIKAPGAVFRRHSVWKRLSYSCTTNEHHDKVLKLDVKVGKTIPHSKWEQYYLYP